MNPSALDLFVELARFVGRVAWHGLILAFRLVAIAFNFLSQLLTSDEPAKQRGGGAFGTIPFPGADSVDPIWKKDDLDIFGRPPV